MSRIGNLDLGTVAEARRRRDAGETVTAIADELGVPYATLGARIGWKTKRSDDHAPYRAEVLDRVAELFRPGQYCRLCGLRSGRWCTDHWPHDGDTR